MKRSIHWPWMLGYAVALALLEAVVVVYLRALYYPQGGLFPMVAFAPEMIPVEMAREVATMVLLLAPAALVTRSALQRFGWFCVLFGVWDLFYYIWLRVLIGWPADILEWDILFLLPVPWLGPVLAPCLVSMGLIVFGVLLLRGRRPRPWHWVALVFGALVILSALVWEPVQHLLRNGHGIWSMQALAGGAGGLEGHVPERFPWWLFAMGCAPCLWALGRMSAGKSW